MPYASNGSGTLACQAIIRMAAGKTAARVDIMSRDGRSLSRALPGRYG